MPTPRRYRPPCRGRGQRPRDPPADSRRHCHTVIEAGNGIQALAIVRPRRGKSRHGAARRRHARDERNRGRCHTTEEFPVLPAIRMSDYARRLMEVGRNGHRVPVL